MGILALNNSILTIGGTALSIGSAAPTWKCVQFSDIASTCPNYDNTYECTCSCICAYPAMSAGESYCLSTSYYVCKPMTDMPYNEYVCIICNGTCIRGAAINTINNDECMGIFSSFCVNYGDCVHAIVKAEVAGGEMESAYSELTIGTITGINGCFCLGTCDSIVAITAAV